jgi:hypothetical protein
MVDRVPVVGVSSMVEEPSDTGWPAALRRDAKGLTSILLVLVVQWNSGFDKSIDDSQALMVGRHHQSAKSCL